MWKQLMQKVGFKVAAADEEAIVVVIPAVPETIPEDYRVIAKHFSVVIWKDLQRLGFKRLVAITVESG